MKIESKATQNIVTDGDFVSKKSLSFKHMDEATQFRRHIDQYNDKYRAVFSEIASNAADEVIFAIAKGDRGKQYEVYLPTHSNPNLIIRDFGRGMTAEQLAENVEPGKTDKNEDNVRIGGFGVGMIAPLCLSDFVIKTRQGGMESTAHVTADGGDGTPAIYVTSESASDNPQGTDVIIPMTTHEKAEILRAMREFLYYMPPKLRPKVFEDDITVPIDYFFDEESIVDLRKENIPMAYIRNGRTRSNDITFVIGQRPYTVRESILPYETQASLRDISRLCSGNPSYFFPNGYLSVSDNRETLSLDKITNERLTKHFKDLDKKIKDHFEKELKAATTLGEAIAASDVLLNSYTPEWHDPKTTKKITIVRGGINFADLTNLDALRDNLIGSYEYSRSNSYNASGIYRVKKEDSVSFNRFNTDTLYDAKVIVFYATACKNHIQRLKIWVQENLELSKSYYSFLIFKDKPSTYLDDYPSCFETICLDDVEVPKTTKDKTKAAQSSFLGAKRENYRTPYYFCTDALRMIQLGYSATMKEQVAEPKRIFYVPTSRTSIDNYSYKVPLWSLPLESMVDRLNGINAFRPKDIIFYASATQKNTSAFKEAKKSGLLINFLHYYRVCVQKTSLSHSTTLDIEAANELISKFSDAQYGRYGHPSLPDWYLEPLKPLIEKAREEVNNAPELIELPMRKWLTKNGVRFTSAEKSNDALKKEFIRATKLLEETNLETLLKYYVEREGLPKIGTESTP